MADSESFLHTTHRTVSWFRKAFLAGELELSAPFQRNPVWTQAQQSYLIDTILNGLPIPELYMQDLGNEDGEEKHIVVDGQQRIRAILEFTQGKFLLSGDDVTKKWRGLDFESLSGDEKKLVFGYKFVVRILPAVGEESIRRIFARLNRNVVALNEQELRNATYWGPFISAIQHIADNDPYWATCGIFSANDHRRMIDHEYISEVAIAYLHGPQNKKDKLDSYYLAYEETFEDRDKMIENFSKVTSEINQILPELRTTRWKKKSDFYTLFLSLASKVDELPFSSDQRSSVRSKLIEFGNQVDGILRLEEKDWETQNSDVKKYARAVARAASDRGSRVTRSNSFESFIFGNTLIGEEPIDLQDAPTMFE